jgi:hypothetical protein
MPICADGCVGGCLRAGRYWYWEIVVLVFRFCISGLILLPVFKPRTILQLIVGFIIVFTYLLACVNAKPMQSEHNNAFNQFVMMQLFVTLLAGLFIRLQAGTVVANFEYGFDELFITTVVRYRRIV